MDGSGSSWPDGIIRDLPHGALLFDLLDSHVHLTISGHLLGELGFPAEALTPLPRTTLTWSEDDVEGMASFNLRLRNEMETPGRKKTTDFLNQGGPLLLVRRRVPIAFPFRRACPDFRCDCWNRGSGRLRFHSLQTLDPGFMAYSRNLPDPLCSFSYREESDIESAVDSTRFMAYSLVYG